MFVDDSLKRLFRSSMRRERHLLVVIMPAMFCFGRKVCVRVLQSLCVLVLFVVV